MSQDTEGPFIVWLDYGYDGWCPYSFRTLREALEYDKNGSKGVITKTVDYIVTEVKNAPESNE